MLLRTLLTSAAIIGAVPAMAATISTSVNIATDRANDLRGLAFAADGKIYASGHVGMVAAETRTILARFNADGTPDSSFGKGGFVDTDLAPGRNEQSLAVAVLANGDAVVGINAVDADGGTSVYLYRFDSAGNKKVGPAWGDAEGKVEVVFGWANSDNAAYPGATTPPVDNLWDIRLDKSSGTERLVLFALGSAAKGTAPTDNDRFVVRLNAADGTPDATFNAGKPFSFHSTGTFGDNARRGLVEADGSIVSAGYTPLGNLAAHVVLIRLLPDGKLDPNFGGFVYPQSSATAVGITATPGVAIFNPFVSNGGFAECYGVARLSDGSYVTTGYGGATGTAMPSTMGYVTTTMPDLVTFRVKGKELDVTWGNKGTMAVQSEGKGKPTTEERGRALVAIAGDRVVEFGRYGGIAAAYVFNNKGQLDTTEGTGGIIELPHATIDAQFFNAVTSPDGKRIATVTNAHEKGARLVVLNVGG